MNKINIYSTILLSSLFTAYGCGSSGSSSMEMVNSNNLMTGVSLLNSKQGQSGGFVDVDGDGIDDKVVGAPYATTATNTGVVLVYKGDGSGGYSSSPSLVLAGDDNFGYSFANIGDVDGDGKSDFAIGAISGDGDSDGDGVEDVSLSGSVYIYKGGSNGQMIRKIAGDEAMDKFGFSVAAGDLDGDGHTDLIVGAPFHTPAANLYQQGAVYIFWGNETSTANFVTRTTISTSYTGLGWAVAAGNVNNDSYSDLVITAGRKALIFNGGNLPFDTTADVTIDAYNSGDKTSDTFKAVAVLGDLDGDGTGEIAAGAPNATVGGNRDTGTVAIVKGSAGPIPITVTVGTAQVPQSPASLLARINGVSLFDRFGSAIVSVPDMDDADTKPELVVGATTANADPDYLSGKVYLFKSTNLSGSSWASPTVFYGTTKDQSYGTFLAPAGNNKLLIGAPRSNIDTGGVSMVDLATGQIVAEGSSGGGGGDSGDCH